MSASLHPGAARDLTEAFRFYRQEAGRGIASRFLQEFERVASLLEEFPDIGTPTGGERRAYPLRGFPYSVIYRPLESTIRILVVRHQSRDPAFGEERA